MGTLLGLHPSLSLYLDAEVIFSCLINAALECKQLEPIPDPWMPWRAREIVKLFVSIIFLLVALSEIYLLFFSEILGTIT